MRIDTVDRRRKREEGGGWREREGGIEWMSEGAIPHYEMRGWRDE